jgi:hypothetical protein
MKRGFMGILVITLFALFVKHMYCDWVIQTEEMVKGKGILFNPDGIEHSLDHGIFTYAVLICVSVFALHIPNVNTVLLVAGIFALIDMVLHYIIDYIKMNYNKSNSLTISDNKFWIAIGVDQLAHYTTYLIISYYFVLQLGSINSK